MNDNEVFKQKQAALRREHAKKAVIDAMTAFGFNDMPSQQALLMEIAGFRLEQPTPEVTETPQAPPPDKAQ